MSFISSLIKVTPIKKSNRIASPIPKINKAKVKFVRENSLEVPQAIKKTKHSKNNLEIKHSINKNKNSKKGKILVQKKIDFHGYSLSDAHEIFLETIYFHQI